MRRPTLPNFAAIWQSIGGAFNDPEEQKRRAIEQAEQLRRAVLYESLVEHKGWTIFQQELAERIAVSEQAILNRLPLPAESAPDPEWMRLQEIAIRGQVHGFRLALNHVRDAIAAAREIVERSKADDDGAPSEQRGSDRIAAENTAPGGDGIDV